MTKASLENISALKKAAQKLRSKERYEWGHMGRCNCGFIAKEITKLSDAEIHQLAMEKSGDWREQLREYCHQSGIAMDVIIDIMVAEGFAVSDLIQLERLENTAIRRAISPAIPQLDYNNPLHVASYLDAWACLLEADYATNDAISIEKNINQYSKV